MTATDKDRQPAVDILERETEAFLRRFKPGKLLVGLSGGADSVALLLALARCGAEVHAVHCNFHLRGDESMRDEKFCRDLCRRQNIPLTVVDFDVEGWRRDKGGSVEMACRDLRYARFEELRNNLGCSHTAVAHNADDNIETMLMNLFRGSGTRGLRAMLPETGQHILRPLLTLDRGKIEAYLSAIGQEFMTDSTNLSSDYRRNFIRRDLLPLVETRWPGVRKAITKTIANMREEETALQAYSDTFFHIGDTDLFYSAIADCHEPSWVVRRFVAQFGADAAIASEVSRSICARPFLPGKRWRVDGGQLVTDRDAIRFVAGSSTVRYVLCDQVMEMSETVFGEIRRNRRNEVLWLPYGSNLCEVRMPRPGDRIAPLGMKGSRLVSDILKESGLDVRLRREVPVVTRRTDGEILWIPGLKRSRLDAIESTSPEVHLISIRRDPTFPDAVC